MTDMITDITPAAPELVATDKLLEQSSCVLAIADEANGDVSLGAFFRVSPPNLDLPSSWVAQFIALNWDGIVRAASQARTMTELQAKLMAEQREQSAAGVPQGDQDVTDVEPRVADPGIALPSDELKLINPNGGFVS